jgi:hypothetical protein
MIHFSQSVGFRLIYPALVQKPPSPSSVPLLGRPRPRCAFRLAKSPRGDNLEVHLDVLALALHLVEGARGIGPFCDDGRGEDGGGRLEQMLAADHAFPAGCAPLVDIMTG